MHDHRHRHYEEEEARSRGRQGDDSRFADRSWRDQGDGRYSGSPRNDRDDRYDDQYGTSSRFDRDNPRWSNNRIYSDSRSERYGSDGQAESRYGNRSRERDIERWEGEGGNGGGYQSTWSPRSSSYSSQPSYAGRGPKDYQRSDERIREEISDRLTDDHRVDATEISVQVSGGQVTLSGSVMDREQKRQAEDVVERVSGVREVTNNIRVSTGSSQPGTGKGRQS